MAACGYVTPAMRIKQEIIELTFAKKVIEDDILNFYKSDSMDKQRDKK